MLLTDGNAQTVSNCRHNLLLNGVPLDAIGQARRRPTRLMDGHEGHPVHLHHKDIAVCRYR